MSALPPEADMLIVGINVCYVPLADIGESPVGEMRNSGMAGIASGHVPEAPPRSAFPLTEESPKKPNRPGAALRDLGGGMVAGWIRPSNHDLGVTHAARRDKREQGGSIAE